MSSQNARILKDFMACYGTGDIDKMCSLLHPDCVFHESGELPYRGDHHGPEGFRALLGQMLGTYNMSFTGAEVLDTGDRVVAKIIATFVSKKSGASVEMPVVEIYSFADNRIIEADVYYREPGWVAQLHEK